MVRRFRAGIPKQEPQAKATPTPTISEPTQEELTQQQIQTNQPQIQTLKTRLENLQGKIAHRQEVGDTTTLHFLLAEKGAILNVVNELKKGKIVTVKDAGEFIQRRKELASFNLNKREPAKTDIFSRKGETRVIDINTGKVISKTERERKATVKVTELEARFITPEQVRIDREMKKKGGGIIPIDEPRVQGTVERVKPDIPKFKIHNLILSPVKTITKQVLPRAEFFLTEQKSKLTTKRSRAGGVLGIKETATGLGIGLGLSVAGTLDAVIHPIQTIKNIPSSIASVYTFTRSGGITTALRTQPAISTGFLGGEIATAIIGGKILTKGLKATGKGKVPVPESIRVISVEKVRGSKSGVITSFETQSGIRIGTIISKNIQDGKLTRTFATGEIFEPKFKIGGELKKTNIQTFIGEIGSKSKKVETLTTIDKLDLKIPVQVDTSLGKLSLEPVLVHDIFKISKVGKAEQIAGIGRVTISPETKFFRTKFELTPKLQSRIFQERVKGIQQVEFTSEATAIKTPLLDSKAIIGFTESRLGIGSFEGLSFKLPDAPKTKGITFIKTGSSTKSFQILLPEQIKLIQQQANTLAIGTEVSKATATVQTPTVKAIITPKLTLDTKQITITKQATTTQQIVLPSTAQVSIVKIMQGLETKQIQTPSTKLGIKQRQTPLNKLETKLNTKLNIKQVQVLSSKQGIKQRQVTMTKLVTPSPTATPIIPIIPTKTITPFIPKLTRGLTPPRQKGLFNVQVKRRGTFRTIGTGLSLTKALGVGQQKVGRTLSATFKLVPQQRGGLQSIKTPFGFKKKKKGLIFIEQPKFRLSTGSEVKSIQIAKELKI